MAPQREDDRAQYEAYEQAVLRDLLVCLGRIPRCGTVPSSPPAAYVSEHAQTLREEYKEYRAEAMDAFELSVAVGGDGFRCLHPAPGGGDQQRLTALEWGKQSVFQLAGWATPSTAGGDDAPLEIVVSSKVDARLARYYIGKGHMGSREGIDGIQFLGISGSLPSTVAQQLGRTRQRPLLSRCLYARALCMLIEADAATSVRARREELKRAAGEAAGCPAGNGVGGHHTSSSAQEDTLGQLCFADLGSEDLVSYFRASGNAPSLPAHGTPMPMCFSRAERCFCAELRSDNVDGQLVQPSGNRRGGAVESTMNDLQRLCLQLDRRYEFAAVRRIGVPEREHFLMGLSLGLGFSWCGDDISSATTRLLASCLAGCLAMVLAGRHLGTNLFS